MAARSTENLRNEARQVSNHRSRTKHTVVPITKVAAPRVRVRLRRVTCDYSQPYPPDGLQKVWWDRLKKALGTSSSDFVNATLAQIQNASRLPAGGISETSVNAVLAFIEGAEPKNELEAALAIQMAGTHAVIMALLSRLGGGYATDRSMVMKTSAVARLLKAFAVQVEALRRLKNGGSQFVRVEHVHLNQGANAVIGNIASTTSPSSPRREFDEPGRD